MKIGLVCPYNIFKGGGVQECVLALRDELSVRGHDALIITPQPKELSSDVPGYIRMLGRSTDVKSPFHTTAQISVIVDPNQVDTLLGKEKFDVLHFHEPWVPLLSKQLLHRNHSKNIATFHAKLPDTVMSRTIEKVITPYTKSVLKSLDGLTAVSDPAASYIRSITNSPIHIIPNGIDLNKYQVAKVKVKRTTKNVLYIGRLEKRKGVKYLLKAFKELQDNNINLIIAGDGPDRISLQKYANDNDINVEFLGRVDDTTKLTLLHDADLFCSPARYGESFGIVLLEAMACGVPIVAGDNPGYSSVLTGSGKLSLVDPRNTIEFSRRIELLLFDQDIRKLWTNWAVNEVPKYDYKHVVDQYIKAYEAL